MLRISMLSLLLIVISISVSFAQVTAVPQRMNFQGRLARPDGTPVPNGNYSIRFRFYDALTGGSVKFEQTINPITVKNGVFAATLSGFSDFSTTLFNNNLWMEIKIGTDAPLTPRQQLVTVAYAFKADSVKDSAITTNSIVNGAVTSAKILNGAVGTSQLANSAVTGVKIANGAITADKFAPNLLNPLAWLLGGNSGVTGGFLGTTDNQPLEFRVNGRRAMRYQYTEYVNNQNSEFSYRSINMLGGSEINEIGAGRIGATIAGGGQDFFNNTDSPNRVLSDFGTVGGGSGNTASGQYATVGGGYNNAASNLGATVAGGSVNTASGSDATVAGGQGNTASGSAAAVTGGQGNIASNQAATVSGGGGNTANGYVSTVAGGTVNTASGSAAMVAGGSLNTAAGANSFAAGRRASANHNGTFVWADYADVEFASTGPNEFLIRATGGVGINTNLPQSDTLHIKGNGRMLNLEGNDHCYIQFFPQTWANGRGAYIGFPGAFSTELVLANEFPGGVVRVVGTFVNSSDARLKHDVRPLDNPLDVLLGLRGVSYLWNADGPEGRRQIGFLAQEVERALPELVYTDEKGYKSVAYIHVVPVLVEAVKTLKAQKDVEINTLKKENDVKTKRLADVEAKNAELEARLERLEAALRSQK